MLSCLGGNITIRLIQILSSFSYSVIAGLDFVIKICTYGVATIMPLTLAKVFERKTNRYLKYYALLAIAFGTSDYILNTEVLIVVTISVSLALCLYYLLTSRRKLSGARWSIVFGLIATLLFVAIVILQIILKEISAYISGFLPSTYLFPSVL
ncbi:MAG: hypothetical protein IPN29_00495 [Saprospiraceae bacterium]|nr:hypothetical protein [Saprospiraceae bacterium]